MTDRVVLKMENIRKSFPGVIALSDLTFELKEGEVHALLGENGAGKSTLIKVLGGIHQPDSGQIYIDGQKVKISSAVDARKLGISIIHQELCLATNMTVANNIFLGRPITNAMGLVNDKELYRKTQELLEEFGITNISPNDTVDRLTVAQQQMIEIVKALSLNARIIVMDEPTSSLTEKEVVKLFEMVQQLRKKNISIVYISHRLEEIFEICDNITVIRDGHYVASLPVAGTEKEQLMSLMVGRQLSNMYPTKAETFGEEVLRVENLTRDDQLKDVSFSVYAGEVLGFYGLVGSGRTETMNMVFGIDKIKSGKIYLYGKELHIKKPIDAIQAGIVLAPENRKEDGLVLIKDIDYNITLPIIKRLIHFFHLDKKKNDSIVDEYGKRLRIKTPSYKQKVINLSGGNQQKVVLAKWLATEPKVLILDEPTRGIDVGAKQEIYHIIQELAKSGVAIILISSELPEIINLSNRVVIMRELKQVAVLDGAEINQDNIIKLALEG